MNSTNNTRDQQRDSGAGFWASHLVVCGMDLKPGEGDALRRAMIDHLSKDNSSSGRNTDGTSSGR